MFFGKIVPKTFRPLDEADGCKDRRKASSNNLSSSMFQSFVNHEQVGRGDRQAYSCTEKEKAQTPTILRKHETPYLLLTREAVQSMNQPHSTQLGGRGQMSYPSYTIPPCQAARNSQLVQSTCTSRNDAPACSGRNLVGQQWPVQAPCSKAFVKPIEAQRESDLWQTIRLDCNITLAQGC